jgi:hypothetical protein
LVTIGDEWSTALKHAGIVEGWEHVCRKPACGYAELAADDQVRRCPQHRMKLWPKAKVRPIPRRAC